MELDLLDDIEDALDRAIVEGKTLRQFTQELTPVLRRRGWWGRKEVVDPMTGKRVLAQLGSPRRLRTIYRSNLRAARADDARARADDARARAAIRSIVRSPILKNFRTQVAAYDLARPEVRKRGGPVAIPEQERKNPK